MVVLYPQNGNMWIEGCHHYGSDLFPKSPPSAAKQKHDNNHAELEGVKHVVKVAWQAALYPGRRIGPRAGWTMINPSFPGKHLL